jgi:hypothetical protein
MPYPRAAIATLLCACLSAPALAQDLIYFEEDGGAAGPRGLYNFDSATGISTLRTAVDGAQRFFGLEVQPSTGRVFATNVPATPCTLWNIDTDTGQATLIGSINNDTIADITFDPTDGRMFANNRNSPYRLYTIDPATAAPTLIGTTTDDARCGLVFSPTGQLYGFSIDGRLAQVDKTTGATTVISAAGVPAGFTVEDSTFTPDGRLFITMFSGHIYQVDLATGAQTLVGTSGSGTGLLGIIAAPGSGPAPCYANCDGSTTPPILNVNDFICFQGKFAAADPTANCDESTTPPTLNVNDFICFQGQFAAGCP